MAERPAQGPLLPSIVGTHQEDVCVRIGGADVFAGVEVLGEKTTVEGVTTFGLDPGHDGPCVSQEFARVGSCNPRRRIDHPDTRQRPAHCE